MLNCQKTQVGTIGIWSSIDISIVQYNIIAPSSCTLYTRVMFVVTVYNYCLRSDCSAHAMILQSLFVYTSI